MSNVSDFAAKGQDLVTRAVDRAVDSVLETVGKVPGATEVRDQVTATANELLALSQDIQNKVIAALKSNA